MDCLSLLLLAVLVAEASGHHCKSECDPETGLRKEELLALNCSYKKLSQCENPSSCDDSTPGTGHRLFSALTEDLIAVERCYSFCYTNVTGGIGEGNVTLFTEDLYTEPACSDKWKAVWQCGCSHCTTGSAVCEATGRDPNTTCSDFCAIHIEGGICERAFPPDVDRNCKQECHIETCPQYCQLVESSFPSQSSIDAVVYSGTLELSLDYTSNVTLKRDGVLEFQIDYFPPLNSTLPPGLAYGLIWKVTYSEGGQTVEQYIAQHLPFLLLPDEVGPLYRIGSNMLAIRDLQCKEDVQLSYALVNAHGMGPFSTMLPQCFYGSWFPIPPNDITTKLGFDYSTGELRLEITSSDLSPDHKYVEGYRVQTVGEVFACPSRLDSTFTVTNDVAFGDKENLSLIIRGTEEVGKFFPMWKEEKEYLVGVYALPQRNRSATKDFIYPVANWKAVIPKLPDYANIQGNYSYEAVPDPITGSYTVTCTLNVTSHWSSLAVVKTVYGILTKTDRPDHYSALYNVTPPQTVYNFPFPNIQPLQNNDVYRFNEEFEYRYDGITFDKSTNRPSFPLPVLPPTPVRNLTVDAHFSQDKNMISATLSWIGPEKPYGKILCYKIVLSTPKISQLGTSTENVAGTIFADNLTAVVVRDVVFNHVEDEFYNFSITAISNCGIEGASECSDGRPVSGCTIEGAMTTFVHTPIPGPVYQSVDSYLVGIMAAVAALLLGPLVLAGIIGFCWYRRNKAVIGKSRQREEERTLFFIQAARPSTSSKNEWEVDPNHVLMKEKLGEGSFGEVYRALITEEVECMRARKYVETMSSLSKSASSCAVAVKLLKPNAPGEMLQSFLNEIDMMKKVALGENAHIVKMVGCVSVQSPYALLLEYVPYGSLLDYLRESRKLTQKRREQKQTMQLLTQETCQYLDSQDETASNGYLSDGQLEQQRALPYLEPVTLNSSNLLHPHQPVSYSQRTPSPTPRRSSPTPRRASPKQQRPSPTQRTPSPTPRRQKVDMRESPGLTPVARKCDSMAINPLYSSPGPQSLYVNLGELEATNLMMFAYQIASGMEYLSSLGIVHRDLACRNILVDQSKMLKISDFGLSRETDLYVCSAQSKLPLRWMSPEAISDRVFTEKSDVWAYGVTIWEICTLGGFPYATTPNKELLPSLNKGYRMERPSNCSEQIYRVMMSCWQMQPRDRPTFKQLKSDLDELLMTLRPNAYITLSDLDDDGVPYYSRENDSADSAVADDDNVFLSPPEVDSGAVNCTLASMGSACYVTTKPESLPGPVQAENGGIHGKIPASPQIVLLTDETKYPDHGVVITPRSSSSTIRDDSGDEETEI